MVTNDAEYEVEPWMASGYTCERCGRDNVARRLIRQIAVVSSETEGGEYTYRAWEVYDVQEVKTCAWCGATHRFSRPEVMPDAD